MSTYHDNRNRIAPNAPRQSENLSYGQPNTQQGRGLSQERSFSEDYYAPKRSRAKVALAVAAVFVVLVGAGLGFFVLSDDGEQVSREAQATASSLAVSDKASSQDSADTADDDDKDKADSKDKKDKKAKKDKASKKKKSEKEKSEEKQKKDKKSANAATKKKRTSSASDDSSASSSDPAANANGSSSDSGSKKPAKKPSKPSSSSSDSSSSQGGSSSSSSGASEQKSGLSIQCAIDPSRAEGYGSSMGSDSLSLPEGSTAYDALCAMGVSVGGNSTYVSSINGLAEKTNGPLSGWMYSVNGVFPNKACGKYVLSDGDVVQWVYTCNLGKDI